MEAVLNFLMNNLEIVGIVLTFIVGLLIKSPIYNKTLKVADLVTKALADGKVTKEEIQSILDALK